MRKIEELEFKLARERLTLEWLQSQEAAEQTFAPGVVITLTSTGHAGEADADGPATNDEGEAGADSAFTNSTTSASAE